MNAQRCISLSIALAAATFFHPFVASARTADGPETIVLTCPVSRMPVVALPSASQVGRVLGDNTAGSSDARLKALLKLADTACKRGASAVTLVPEQAASNALVAR